MKYLFLDTNIFLHFRDFEEIPWSSVVGVNDDFSICITPTVLDELDDQKDNSKGKIQKRAKRYSSKLFDYFTSAKTCKYSILRIQESTPTKEDTLKLDINKKDNLILLSALHSGYNLSDIIIISADKHILLKASDLHLGYLQMPEEYQLHENDVANHTDNPNTDNTKSKQESFLPKLVIAFADEQNRLSLSRPTIIDDALRLKEVMDAIKKEVPDKQYVEPSNSTDLLSMIAISPFNTKEMVDRYNHDRDEYLQEELTYHHLKIQKEILDNRFKKITLDVVNIGKAPSGDMVIVIEFPESVKLFTTKESRDCMSCATPIKPNMNLMVSRETIRTMASFQQGYGKENFCFWNQDKYIKKHKYLLETDSLMHNFKRELNLHLYIDTLKESSFLIRWSAQAGNSPTIDTGELQVNID